MSCGGHVWYECPKPCDKLYCMFCEGGLASCVRCNCDEGTLPDECPGVPVPSDKQDLIYTGKLNYRAKKMTPPPPS